MSSSFSINKTRRKRGYNFEYKLVQELNLEDWQCRRLGGSSTGLPDLGATNNIQNILLAIECKSTVGKYCYVPKDQLERCNTFLSFFNRYENKYIILAFKFGTKGKTSKRLRYYFWVLPRIHEDLSYLSYLRCDYDGKLITVNNKDMKQDKPLSIAPTDVYYRFLKYDSFRTYSIESMKNSIIPGRNLTPQYN